MRFILVLAVALLLLFPAGALAWSDYKAASGGDMPDSEGHYNARHGSNNQQDRPQQERTYRERPKPPKHQRDRYTDQGGVLKDTYTGREYQPGEVLPDGGVYDPGKDYD